MTSPCLHAIHNRLVLKTCHCVLGSRGLVTSPCIHTIHDRLDADTGLAVLGDHQATDTSAARDGCHAFSARGQEQRLGTLYARVFCGGAVVEGLALAGGLDEVCL
jgi:hypothetical protein